MLQYIRPFIFKTITFEFFESCTNVAKWENIFDTIEIISNQKSVDSINVKNIFLILYIRAVWKQGDSPFRMFNPCEFEGHVNRTGDREIKIPLKLDKMYSWQWVIALLSFLN